MRWTAQEAACDLASEVCLLYRRSRNELPARHEEIENAEEEGLICKFLAAPVEFYGDEKGWVKAMKVIAMELTEPDAKGRRGVKDSSRFRIHHGR